MKFINRLIAYMGYKKPSKDAEEGIDVRDLRTAGKILEVYKKILKQEVK